MAWQNWSMFLPVDIQWFWLFMILSKQHPSVLYVVFCWSLFHAETMSKLAQPKLTSSSKCVAAWEKHSFPEATGAVTGSCFTICVHCKLTGEVNVTFHILERIGSQQLTVLLQVFITVSDLFFGAVLLLCALFPFLLCIQSRRSLSQSLPVSCIAQQYPSV